MRRFPKLVASKGPEAVRLVGESMRGHAFDNDLDQGRELMSILADELLPLVLADTVVNLDAHLLEEVPVMMAR